MALLFMDGFSGGDAAFKWDIGSSAYSTQNGAPRVPGGYYGYVSSFSGCSYYKTITASNKCVIGFGSYFVAGSVYASFFGDSGATQHITVVRNSSTGVMEIRRGGSGGTLLASGTQPTFTSTWFYLEISCTISATVGEVHVRLNGQTTDEVSYTGNTKNGGTNTTVDRVLFDMTGAITMYIADVYILNDTGSAPLNDFLGDVTVRTLTPTGNGNYSQLTNSAGNSTNNYTYVDEHPFSGADYTGSATSGQKDSYAMSDLPAGVTTVYGVQVCGSMAKSDATLGQSRYFVRSAGNDYPGTTRALTTSFIGYYDMYTTDPATGVAWTVGGLNSAEGGMEVV